MNDINNFYDSILNIGNIDKFEKIKEIVNIERKKLLNQVDELDGFCKFIANQIECDIKENISGVKTTLIDLNDISNIDHVFLIAEYRFNNEIKKILIDPTFVQFAKQKNKALVNLKYWPSEKLDSNFVDILLKDGLIKVNEEDLKKYLRAFNNIKKEDYKKNIQK